MGQHIHLKPIFPEFKSLKIEDQQQIESYTQKYLPYSDFNFVSLWCYDTNKDVIFSWINNNLIIRFQDYLTKSPFYSFLGDTLVSESIDQLFTYSKKQKIPQV